MNPFHMLLCRLRPAASPKQACVIGCGRSGTKFTTHMIQDVLGMSCEHEVRNSSAQIDVSWKLAIDPKIKQKFHHILHQVREPLACIASLQTFAWHIHYRKRRFASIRDIHPDNPPLFNSISYWYHWNTLCESISTFRYQIEAIDAGERATIGQLCWYLGVSPDEHYSAIVAYCEKNRRINSRRHSNISWDTIQAVAPHYYGPIVEMAERYGYATPTAKLSDPHLPERKKSA